MSEERESKSNGYQISETENRIQELLGKLIGITDKEEREKIQEKINQLKETPQGQADQKKHNQIVSGRQEATKDN
jgi:hypothetical protein